MENTATLETQRLRGMAIERDGETWRLGLRDTEVERDGDCERWDR